MKAFNHFRASCDYAHAASENESFEPALLQAVLSVAEALQALVLLQALEEQQNPHWNEQWRLQWQSARPSPSDG